MAYLKAVEGSRAGERFQVEGEVPIGRSLSNAVCVADARASRHHARILRTGGGYAIEDLKSANGTTLNGERLRPGTPAALEDGDTVEISGERFTFHDDESENAARTPTGRASESSVSLTTFGGVAVRMSAGGEQPAVDLTLDASRSLVDLPAVEISDPGEAGAVIQRLQAMCRVSIALGSVLDRDELMRRIIDCLFEIFPLAERAFIMLADPSGALRPVAARTRDAENAEIRVSRTILNRVQGERRSLLLTDAQSDQRFSDRMSIVDLELRSVMCAPLLTREAFLGLIQVDTTRAGEPFTQQDLEVLTGIGTQAAIAVRNAQLYAEIEVETGRRASLQRYFSPNLVEMLMRGEVKADLGGKRYRGTVFFCDIIGFTSMAERLPPETVVANLNRYFNVLQRLIYQNGGNVDKFGGDAILAFWSVPRREAGDEGRAVLTGVLMQAQLWPLNRTLSAEGQEPIRMGVGINHGEFIAGNVGRDDRIEFTLIPAEGNLAARLEECAGREQIFISDALHEEVKASVACIRLPSLMVKGKSVPRGVFSVRAAATGQAGEVASCIGFTLETEGGAPLGEGMLLGATGAAGARRLIANCTDRPAPQTRARLRLRVLEYHDALALEATVASATVTRPDGGASYTRVLFSDVRGDEALRLLSPGETLQTQLDWTRLRRE